MDELEQAVACIINILRSQMMTILLSISDECRLLITLESSFTIVIYL
jgi:hypothetical protein